MIGAMPTVTPASGDTSVPNLQIAPGKSHSSPVLNLVDNIPSWLSDQGVDRSPTDL